ncbi:hypothetical protein ROA7745_02169 [Roseovarius aestuarii]|uniref:Uncharacterized protein n=1 Tax=Roseovarius aestuarii TaxID=475083 RepID=A0A1X7BS01_9RHOB|nr:hypothetical protein ROA7745_02169 [Roseovarius aestuarii]
MQKKTPDGKQTPPIKRRCHRCHGSGRAPCEICGGKGEVPQGKDAYGNQKTGRCSGCFGSRTRRCATCNGEGFFL